MIIVFFSFSKLLVCDFLSNGVSNNSQYMCQHIWPAIEQELKKKRPKRGSQGIFLHFDNSPIHKSKQTLEKIKELGFPLHDLELGTYFESFINVLGKMNVMDKT